MDDCNETLRELDTFLDDEMDADARSTIRSHLHGCPDCLQAFDFQAELKMVIAEKCRREELPPSLLAKIRACFEVGPDNESPAPSV